MVPVLVPPRDRQARPLRQHLEYVAPLVGGLPHHVEDLVHELEGHARMEHVRHAVDEHAAGTLPAERRFEALRHKLYVLRLGLVPANSHRPQARVHGEHVAVVAAGGDAGAAGHRVPGLVSPFDRRWHDSQPLYILRLRCTYVLLCQHGCQALAQHGSVLSLLGAQEIVFPAKERHPRENGGGNSGSPGPPCDGRPSHEQPVTTPNTVPTAIALTFSMLLRQCPLNAPAHTPAAPPRPHPAHPLSVPRKSVTFLRHPSPAMPHPPPRAPHLIPTTAQFLPTNPPQPRILAHPLEAYAHSCYPRPREGPTPRPGNPDPKRGEAPGIRRSVENWSPATGHRRALCPALSRGATSVSRRPRVCRTAWRRTAGNRSYETHRMSQKLTDFAFPFSREHRCWWHEVT